MCCYCATWSFSQKSFPLFLYAERMNDSLAALRQDQFVGLNPYQSISPRQSAALEHTVAVGELDEAKGAERRGHNPERRARTDGFGGGQHRRGTGSSSGSSGSLGQGLFIHILDVDDERHVGCFAQVLDRLGKRLFSLWRELQLQLNLARQIQDTG